MERFQQSPHVLAADISDDELVMMDVDRAKYFGTRATATDIWKMFEEPRTIDEVVADLLEAYEVDEAVCRDETTRYVESLRELDLLVALD